MPRKSNSNRNLESLRQHYKPANIVLLLVGESPPRLKGFFYDTTVSEGQLSRNTRKVFQDHYKKKFAGREEFLSQFKARGCYLVDLFQQRGKIAHKADKDEKLVAIRKLAKTLKNERPIYLASVLKRIQKLVEQAIREAEVSINYRSLYYPTRQYIPC